MSRSGNRTFLLVSMLIVAAARADESVLEEFAQAKQELTNQRCQLRYKYQPGETLSYTIEHLVAIDTTIAGNNQKTKLRSKSSRSLRVEDVTAEENIRFVHVVDHIDMWSEIGGREPVHFASDQSEPIPAEYQQVAETVGKPISVITINPRGIIIDRQDKVQHPDLGLGGITIPLPEGEIEVGATWSQPLELKVRLQDDRIKTIKTRESYKLEKLETGIATISIKTEILTPIDDPRVKSQIVQRISQGEVRFDVDAGRLVSKRLEWDESVLGFNGAESRMTYLAQFTETLVDVPRTADKSDPGKS